MRQSRPSQQIIARIVAEVFPATMDVRIEPVRDGVSTYVYRLLRGSDVFYLRVLPEADARFTPEAQAHRLAAEHGARVPEVLFVEDESEFVHRAVMITRAIPGEPISHVGIETRVLRSLLNAAGRDLARINQVTVDGFGWIRRDGTGGAGLRGDHATEQASTRATLEEVLLRLDQLGLTRAEERAVRNLADSRLGRESEHAWLAHGDFDAAHIYQHQGRYSGIIDFGEIRGANRWYDLAHVRLHDGELIPTPLLPWLLDGYAQITPLPADLEQRLQWSELLIALHALARSHARQRPGQSAYQLRLRAAIADGILALKS